jgi:hypothetical protein
MILRSKIPKIIHTPLQKWSRVSIILELSVNYFSAQCQLFWKFWSGVSFVENKVVASLVSPNIRSVNIIYPKIYYLSKKKKKNHFYGPIVIFPNIYELRTISEYPPPQQNKKQKEMTKIYISEIYPKLLDNPLKFKLLL